MRPSASSAQIVPNASHVEWAGSRLVEHFAPLQILVFGSFAQGNATPGSDLDLLVVLPSVANRREAAVAMRRVLADLPVPKDVVVTTSDEVEKRRHAAWHIVGRALEEGRVVYSSRGRT